jgi:DNA-binding XRE family transcriptional regulator
MIIAMSSRSSTERTTDDYLDDALARDPAFRERWYAGVLARTFGLAVLRHRTEHGVSQAALGRALGIPQSQVARIEDGEHTPSLPTMLRVCDALGLDLTLTIGPRRDARRPVPRAGRGAADATDQVTVAIRPART